MVSSRAYKEARKHFGLVPGDGLVLHHVDQTLRHTNRERYNEWRPEDLVVMTTEEHTSLHHKGKKYGPRSEETRAKMSEAHKGKKLTPQHIQNKVKACQKPVEQYAIGGELVRVWESAKQAEKEGFKQSKICKVCKGKGKTHKGYVWRYANNTEK